MTLEEKLSQLVGVWVGADASGEGVAPHQSDMLDDGLGWPEVIRYGLGQLTRPFGTAPVDPAAARGRWPRSQAQIVAASRFGIPAQRARGVPHRFRRLAGHRLPDPAELGRRLRPGACRGDGRPIGRRCAPPAYTRGSRPVLDVTRDYRWGRTEETIGEDPYLVGTIGAAYVRGLETTGIVATLKHFAGYSASRGGRNLAPVSMGRGSWPTSSCRRSRWRYGSAVPAP